ncbi:hypothetical protein SMU80_06793 [Streptococcus mutans SF1]|nr:hypothetical protein SMU80_06793 [Streptococcus mutans SF1]
MATIIGLYHLNPTNVSLPGFTNQWWKEELAKYVSLFQETTKTLYQLKLSERR